MPPTTPGESRPEHVRTYLQLTRLLDGIQKDHPEVSAPLRLTLLRARRDGQMGCLDESRFRAVVADVGTVTSRRPAVGRVSMGEALHRE